ncbi:Crp/Fnr family transcriptional regulator [Alicyclobacillus contaminans]|uniref:Crp/Fnr family transcriptional regulator n=1 Tax=Alicyclobacillus contaminans TaxID=392016 RepID=UPI0003F74004|nr:Crp/Fnr family transcriptional regulator [Alicyclobacillus contaminans]GMA50693.1 Crp/Fnr family transcriptional regulator [Alicyclobacillus contaminans]
MSLAYVNHSPRNTSLFTVEQMAKLMSHMSFREYATHTTIARNPDEMYVLYIKWGKVRLNILTDQGKEVTVSALNEGDMLFWDEALKQVTIRTNEPTRIGWIKQSVLDALLREDPDLASTFVRWQTRMNALVMMKLRDLLLFGKHGALSATLVRLANTYGETVPDGIRIPVRLTNEELAKFIGATRETVNRMLRSYVAKGVLSVKGPHIVIHNMAYLKCEHQCLSCPPNICRT